MTQSPAKIILCRYINICRFLWQRDLAWVCSQSPAMTAGSNPVGDMDVSCECCVLSGRQKSLRRDDHSSRRVLQALCVCVCVCVFVCVYN